MFQWNWYRFVRDWEEENSRPSICCFLIYESCFLRVMVEDLKNQLSFYLFYDFEDQRSTSFFWEFLSFWTDWYAKTGRWIHHTKDHWNLWRCDCPKSAYFLCQWLCWRRILWCFSFDFWQQRWILNLKGSYAPWIKLINYYTKKSGRESRRE